MNKRGDLNLGDEIRNKVQSALNNKDFKKLNKDVENIVRSALDEVRGSLSSSNKGQEKNREINREINIDKVHVSKNNREKIYLNLKKHTVPVGRVSGVLFTVFGSITSIGFGMAVFILVLLGFLKVAIGLSPLFILSIILLVNGNNIRKRLKRFQKYIAIMRGKSYYPIEDLSKAARLSNKFVIKDLDKMISLGMFPQGHIDDDKNWFMLNDATYRQYLELQKGIEMNNIEKKNLEKKPEKELNRGDRLSPEIRKSIEEGRNFVLEIKQANSVIPGDEISSKLDRLEEVTGKIYDYVEIHPEKFAEIKKFTEYFLPTTLKLLDAYRKLDYQSVQGENISNAKKEIERTLDTINLAFENLLDDLFQDMAMDISTDISVLETMFAQEGLTNENMRFRDKKKEDK